ncbi:MAG TPA: MnhB domain-containing protein [Streptosporangiaceae bacterium]|nr:MnhB domain-containing protein [Streptosporangiaceae bacterium]
MPDASVRHRSGRDREAAEHEPAHRRAVGLLLAGGMLAALAVAVAAIPREHAPLSVIARYAMLIALPRWNLTEPVNEIVYGTRGFDTFAETFLLLAAVVSVIVLTRPREPRRGYFGEEAAAARERAAADPAERADEEERLALSAERREQGEEPAGPGTRRPETPDRTPLGVPAPETADAMSIVVRTAIRIALPVLAVAGLYIVAYGFSPGAGFPGGAVMLGVVLLAYAGFGRRRISRVVRPALVEVIELAGGVAITVILLLGLVLEGSFGANWLPLAAPETILSGGVAQAFSASELVEVGTGLIIVIFAVLGMSHDWTPDQPEPDANETDKGADEAREAGTRSEER